jgi:ubiquitin carboxyl-terminal hydrolase 7
MPDLGHDVKDFTVYSWRLNNWKKLEKKLTSPEFDCGGHKWSRPIFCFTPYFTHFFVSVHISPIRRILLFPFGNSNAPPNDTVSVYLDYADPKKAPEGWHACAQFALVISNIHDPTIYTVSRAFVI